MVVPLPVGRLVLRILIAALCVAAAVAALALLRGDFSDTDGRIILTSTLFALVSAMAAAGLAVGERLPLLAAATVVASGLAFVLVTVAIWTEIEAEAFWRPTGCVAIVALESAHVSAVLSRLRSSDSPRVVAVTRTAVGLALVSGAMGIAAVVGLWSDVEDVYVELLGVVLIGQLLCTALPPLMRRMEATAERPVAALPTERERLATELAGVADRLERLDAGPHVHAECERLRRLARAAAR
jgi:hypothetical protein